MEFADVEEAEEPIQTLLISSKKAPRLPLPISFNLDIGQEFKSVMKRFQMEKGRCVPQMEFVRACNRGDLKTVREAVLASRKKQDPPYRINADCADRCGFTLLMQVCQRPCKPSHPDDDLMEYLVQAGADINARHRQSGQCAIHIAIQLLPPQSNQACKLRKLLFLKAALNIADEFGYSPLMLATKLNRQHMIFLLLEFGADFNAVSNDGKTAFQLATHSGFGIVASAIICHSQRVKECFEEVRSQVLIDILQKRDISPLHCFGLWESSEFNVTFSFKPTRLPNQRYGYVVTLAVVHFNGQHVNMRMWGPCPFANVEMNNQSLRPLQDQGRFVFLTSLKSGLNRVRVVTESRACDSQMRMVLQVILVQLKRSPMIKPPDVTLEQAPLF